MKVVLLVLLIAILPAAMAAGKNSFSFPIKHLNKPIKTNLAALRAPPRTIYPNYTSDIFYIEMAIGTPPTKTYTAFDTLTPITWLQVPECQTCLPVAGGVSTFDPRNSSTFTSVSSDDPICTPDDPILTPSSNGSCLFDENGLSSGFLGTDILSYSFDAAAALEVSFGCGLFNSLVLGGGSETPISGVMGLGPGHPLSLLYQLRPVIRDTFSYCISPPLSESKDATLDFGPDAVRTGADVQSTRLIIEQPLLKQNQYYVINVTGMTVNGGVLGSLPKEGFKFGIDSMFTYTVMSKQYFQGLRDAVAEHFLDNFGMTPLNETETGFDLCYDVQKYGGGDVFMSRAPAVVLNLEGGAFLELKNSFAIDRFAGQGCLQIISVTDTYGSLSNMLGVQSQMSYRFLFELDKSKLSFSPDMC